MEGRLEHLRRLEIDAIRSWFRPGARVLELGGGTGYQARLIAALGCEVTSIDLPGARDRGAFYPVKEYDGVHVPAADASTDIVFSSNVLAHIPHLPSLLGEVRRVLSPGGVAIHVVPTATWRLWTSLSYPAFVLKSLLGKQPAAPGVSKPIQGSSLNAAVQQRGIGSVFMTAIRAPFVPVGANANALVELAVFRRSRWLQLFEDTGFSVEASAGNHCFYTGNALLQGLSDRTRRQLAMLLGSACHIFVMRSDALHGQRTLTNTNHANRSRGRSVNSMR